MISEEDKLKNKASWVHELNKLNWNNIEIAERTGLSVMEVSRVLLGDMSINKSETKDEVKTGSICKKCQTGKVALMDAMIGCATLDDEPYKEGVKKGDNETVELQDYISLSIHACDTCGYVYSSHIED